MASRPAAVRYYFDEDVLGVAKVLAALRPDVSFPGDPGATVQRRTRPPSPIPRGAKDDEWIPVVAARGWLIVTRDSAIQRHPSLVRAVITSGARMVALSGAEAIGTWAQLEVVMSGWRRLESLSGRAGPFVVTMTRTSMRDVTLDPP